MTPGQAAIICAFVMILNLTTITLPTSSSTLLRKGLSYIPTKRCTKPHAQMIASTAITELHNKLAWTEHFASDYILPDVNLRLCEPSTAAPPRGSRALRDFTDALRTSFDANIDTAPSTRWNHSQRDIRDLYQVAFSHENEVLAQDKHLGPVYIPRSWRLNESLSPRHLADSNTYGVCSRAEKNRICAELVRFIKSNDESSFQLTTKEFKGLLSKTQDAIASEAWPKFNLLPKVHKFKVKPTFKDLASLRGRPLIGAHSCPSSLLSIYVSMKLAPHSRAGKHVLPDSKSLARVLAHQRFPVDCVIATADVCSLYPRIPTDWGVRVVKAYLLRRGVSQEFATVISTALKIVLKSNIFRFQDQLYVQRNGTAMGTNCAVDYATIVLIVVESNTRVCFAGIFLYYRYIDDLVVVAATQAHADAFFITWQSIRPADFVLEIENGPDHVDFLNITIFKNLDFLANGGLLSIKPYAKKFNQFMYLPFSSHHPVHMKKAFVKGLASNLVITCGTFSTYIQELSLCYDRLRHRGYPLSLLAPILKSIKYSARADRLAPRATGATADIKVLKLPYNSIFCTLPAGRLVRDAWDSTMAVRSNLHCLPIVCWTRTYHVLDLMNIARVRFLKDEQELS